MSRHDWKNELSELIVRKLDGSLSDDEFKRLETILSEGPATVQFYVKVIITNALLEDKSSIPIGEGEVHQALELSLAEQPLDSDVSTLKRWQVDAQLHEIEQYAEMEFERFREQERKRQEELAYREYRAWRRRYILAAGSLAAFVAIVFFVWLVPQLEPNLSGPIARTIPAEPALVATLVKAQNALWEQGNASAEVGSRLRALPGFLKQGLIQITFDDGAEVILQAPCHFCLDDAGRITLFRGVLSAVVSEQAKGFAVQTPTGVVTDYGTEFGVIARENGETETQVYIGKVLLEGNPDLVSTHAPRFLTQGQARAVDRSGRIHFVSFQEHQIVREMPNEPGLGMPGKRLDLADMVGGGNGFGTGTLESGIDPATGSLAYPSINKIRTCQTLYISIPSLPFVDGVFVPDGTKGPVCVSGENHEFVNFPPTSGLFYSDIAHGGRLLTKGTTEYRALTLGGIIYGTLEHPAIVLHANAGITFDLEAIRSANPGFDFTRFSSICGISQDTPEGQGARADFWVLVDGKERFWKTAVTPSQGSIPVEVPLDRQDRYLTLMATDNSHQSDADISNDYGLFAEPVLE